MLLYAYNGTGKTPAYSATFKDLGKNGDDRDTLYFNAFTEDLFNWDNDLKNDRERVLKINRESRFFAGLDQFEMDNRIRPLLDRYADFDFKIDTDEWEVSFSRGSGPRRRDYAKTMSRRHQDFPRRGEHLHLVLFHRHRATRARRRKRTSG